MSDDKTAFCSSVESLINDARQYQTFLAPDRIKAMEYYDGVMKDLPSRPNWSSVVSRDVRAMMTKALPSVKRTLLGNDKIVEYGPEGEGDEEFTEQATDYVNSIILPECHGDEAILDACFDALLFRNGVLTWGWEEKTEVTGSQHSGLDPDALAELVNAPGVEVLEQSQDETGFSVSIKRTKKQGRIVFEAVPLEELLVHPDALKVEEAALVGRSRQVTRSDLIAMGYDRDMVESLPEDGASVHTDQERFTRRRNLAVDKKAEAGELQKIDYYDVYVRLDYDDDGIAELRHVCMAGGMAPENLLVNELADEIPYADVVSERRPHQWEGVSLADDVIEIQMVKTALLRAAMDNIYWHNAQQVWVQRSAILNPDAVMAPEFGKPVFLKEGFKVSDAVAWPSVPVTSDKALELMAYWDKQAKERSGIDDASAGLPPDALQNVTAKATALLEQAGIARIEMMVDTIAKGGLKKAFQGLLRAIVKHQDKPRTIMLRDKWTPIDPRHWNAGLNAVVNTGLGAGTRERDMLVMNQVLTVQERLISQLGVDNPFVKPDNVYNAIEKMLQAAGLKSTGLFITQPDPQEVEQKLQAARNKPDPEMVKIQGAMQLEQMKAHTAAEKEKAQAEADIIVKREQANVEAKLREHEVELEQVSKHNELVLKKYEIDQKIELEREKMDMQMHSDSANRGQNSDIEYAKMGMEKSGEGKPVDRKNEAVMKMIDKLSEQIAASAKPKRVVRNKQTGDIEGIETIN